MPVIALQGVRGGVGTTSVTAGLAWSLQRLGASVLVIDYSPENLTRLYFNMPITQTTGWARAIMDGTPWQTQAMRYTQFLDFVPYGTLTKTEQMQLECIPEIPEDFWKNHLNIADLLKKKRYDWILMDLPSSHLTYFAQYGLSIAEHRVQVLNPDMSCHILLEQQESHSDDYFLVNDYNPSFVLQQDIMQLWHDKLPNIIPYVIHSDQMIAESIAMKQPPGEYGSNNLAAKDLRHFADWCCGLIVASRS